jgi:membrane-associated protease RseP (regulator of RpoE activity)
MDFYTISVLAFAAVLVLLLWLDRKNVKRESILLLRRTTRGKRLIERIGQGAPRFWKAVGTTGVVAGFAASVFMFYLLLVQTWLLATGAVQFGPGLLLPSPTPELQVGPGYFGVPFWFWIISIAVLALVHEGMHGIIAASENVRIRSLGWGVLAVLPLAFVEPDEEQLKKEKPWKQMRVFAAGSFSNFLTAFAVLVIAGWAVGAAFVPGGGVGFSSYVAGLPAQQSNLTGYIMSIDGAAVRDASDLEGILGSIAPGTNITITTLAGGQERAFHLTTAASPDNASRSFIGISGVYNHAELRDSLEPWSGAVYFFTGTPDNFMGLLSWLFLINLFVGLFNLLPIGPLDGGRLWGILLSRVSPRHGGTVLRYAGYVTFSIILLDFVLVFT